MYEIRSNKQNHVMSFLEVFSMVYIMHTKHYMHKRIGIFSFGEWILISYSISKYEDKCMYLLDWKLKINKNRTVGGSSATIILMMFLVEVFV